MIDVTEEALRKLPAPNQILGEWKMYLRFLRDICDKRGITAPTVLEIGTQWGGQKKHYETFLDATHIGVDISNKFAVPDILADSHKPTTVARVRELLAGRPLNFLFIDGAHTYDDAASDFYAYGPLARDVIAFHDIRHEKGIADLWNDIQAAEKGNANLSFYKIGGWGGGWCELGIGLILKGVANG